MGLFDSLRSRLFWLAAPAPEPEASLDPTSDTDTSIEATVDEAAAPTTDSATAETVAETVEPIPEQPSDTSATTEPDLSARQERAAGRLLEDERLRGDLSDDEFQPLLDWAMKEAEQLVDSTAGDSDDVAEQRIDIGLSIVRERMTAVADAVTAYAQGDHDRLTAALCDAGLLLRDARADGVIARLFVQRDLAGPEVAAQIVSQLATGAVEPSDRAAGGAS